MTSPTRLGALFSPLRVGGVEAKNRVFRAATSTNLAEENRVGERLLAHYRTVARGGVGTVVTEAMRFHPSAVTSPNSLALVDEGVLPGLRRLVEVVREAGALIIGQINHSGRQHTSTKIPAGLVGPSSVACPRSGGVPHELAVPEIEDLVAHAGRSASLLAAADFDGVEVHCAQGHLLQQFLSPFSNRRDDRYGGSQQSRMRFPAEMVRAVRGSFEGVVGLRLGVDEFTDGGLTRDMAIEFAAMLVDEGAIDYVSLSQGNFNTIDTHLPDRHYDEMPFVALQAGVKEAIPDTVVIACTRILDPLKANALIEGGQADAVALSRALIVDPEWPAKAESGALDTIRHCIGCNECWDGLHGGAKTISCVQNPTAGREMLEIGPPATKPRRVLVIGGGPAGMEAASTAAQRGHEVILLERDPSLGGKVRIGSMVGGHDDLANVSRYLERVLVGTDVEVRTATPASRELIEEIAPDVVLVATGATPVADEIDGDGSVPNDAGLPDFPGSMRGERVIVVDADGHYWAAQVAEEASRRDAEVIVVTRFFEPFRELPMVSRIAALRRLHAEGARFLPLHRLKESENGAVIAEHFESGRSERIDRVARVVWVGPQKPNTAPADMARAAGVAEIHVIGDAFAPRRIKNAIYEGFDAGRSL